MPPTFSSTRQEHRNRQALLTKVKNFWINGVLEQSLHNQVLITLDLAEQENAVVSPWNLTLETRTQLPRAIPSNTSVISLFEQIGEGRTLLILGEPGAGKTITLLQLARDLLIKAEQAADALIPVVLNLSSWTEFLTKHRAKSSQFSQVTIAEWLVKELNSKYQVPKQIGRNWVKKQQLLLLLDGLDEVRSEHRDGCVAALNAFQQEYGTEMVVCSRIKDYDNLTNRLTFQSAIFLRSLTQEQICGYLDSLNTELTSLRTLLEVDIALQELAQSPLMLHIMVLAYQDITIRELPQVEIAENHRQNLFNSYIRRMLKRRRGDERFSPEQTLNWLSWLAQQMQINSQTVFLIEQMQPTWLQTRKQKRNYRIGSVLLGGLSYGLISGLLLGISFGLFLGIAILIGGATYGVFAAIVATLVITLFCMFFGLPTGASIVGFTGTRKGIVRAVLLHGLLTGSLLGLIVLGAGLTNGLKIGLIKTILSVLTVGLSSGAYGGFIVWLAGGQSKEIEPAEKLSWSWQKARRGLFVGIAAGVLVGLGNVITGGQDALLYLLYVPPIYGLASALINGLSTAKLEAKAIPNQGIRSSAKNFVMGGLILGLGCILIMGLLGTGFGMLWSGPLGTLEGTLSQKILIGLLFGLFVGLWFGTTIGVIGGMKFGGKACVQHLTLRLLLHRQRSIPWNYAEFLDYATERLFLQKVGGGYIFVHRSLMEHFAQMVPTPAQVPLVENFQLVNQANRLSSLSLNSESGNVNLSLTTVTKKLSCHICKQNNPASFNFCIKCGVSLIGTCPACDYKNLGNFNFCTKCGTSLK